MSDDLPKSKRGRRRAARVASSCAGLLLLSGCVTLERQGFMPTSPSPPAAPPAAAPKVLGAGTPDDAERTRLVALYGGAYHWPKAEAYLNNVLARLAKASDTPAEPYRVTILNSGVVNAFALPSGDLFVTRGLLALANDTSEIAAVMAHEIGHVVAHHAFLRAEEEKKEAVIDAAARVIESREKSEQVAAHSALIIANYSRMQELQADSIGIRVIARAGYDPYAAARFLNSLQRSAALRASLMGQKEAGRPDILATHPSTPARIQAALQQARQFGPPGTGQRARAAYLASINGIAFGDDPKDGAIRGREFIHPRLGFSFEAPPGFVLENSSQAVLGVAYGGAQALRLDSVTAPQGKTLRQYLISGWIDGLMASSIHKAQVNGLPAVLATARAGEWNFRVAIIGFRDDTYRIIFAVRALTPSVDATFLRSIDSFHPLTVVEAIKADQPQRLQVVVAGPNDTAETLAAKMAAPDRPLDQFLLLNGLDSPKIKAGESYKIIVN